MSPPRRRTPAATTSALPLLPGWQEALTPAEANTMAEGHSREQPLTVAGLTQRIKTLLTEHPSVAGPLWLQAELSGIKRSARGHVYLTLKDDAGGLDGIVWASQANKLPFSLDDGLAVLVSGHLSVYEQNGRVSFVIQNIEPLGVGALQLAFEQLKAKLAGEGLFTAERKKPLPEFVTRLGIITSPHGAVIHDMMRTLRQKNPLIEVLFLPVPVQGDGAEQAIAAAIRELTQPDYALDAVIVARGGGSFDDLFCFSTESVVRAIAASPIPIVTGIGHEPDFGLADAVADYSAATPTMAMETVAFDWYAQQEQLTQMGEWLTRLMHQRFETAEQQLDRAVQGLGDRWASWATQQSQRLATQQQSLHHGMQTCLTTAQHRLQTLAAELDAHSPLATLAKGYCLVQAETNANPIALRNATPGQRLMLTWADAQGTGHTPVVVTE